MAAATGGSTAFSRAAGYKAPDFGAIVRCVYDCTEEVYFLLEEFPKASSNIDKFVKCFFEHTIDGYLSTETPSVPTQKIRSAAVRVLKGNERTRTDMENIYKTFCGYVHANYSHIMEVYNGATYDFNLSGVPSVKERQIPAHQCNDDSHHDAEHECSEHHDPPLIARARCRVNLV